jgi:hypothetical protein
VLSRLSNGSRAAQHEISGHNLNHFKRTALAATGAGF